MNLVWKMNKSIEGTINTVEMEMRFKLVEFEENSFIVGMFVKNSIYLRLCNAQLDECENCPSFYLK